MHREQGRGLNDFFKGWRGKNRKPTYMNGFASPADGNGGLVQKTQSERLNCVYKDDRLSFHA